MSKDTIRISFNSAEDRDNFAKGYDSPWNENYNGRSVNTRDNYDTYEATIERSGVADFTRLGQDVQMTGGKIDMTE